MTRILFLAAISCFLCSCGGRTHPVPKREVVLFLTSPSTGRVVAQIVAFEWSDGLYREPPIVRFLDDEDNLWIVSAASSPKGAAAYLLPDNPSSERLGNLQRLAYPYQEIFSVPFDDPVIVNTKREPKAAFAGFEDLIRYSDSVNPNSPHPAAKPKVAIEN